MILWELGERQDGRVMCMVKTKVWNTLKKNHELKYLCKLGCLALLGQKEMSADNGAWALLVASRAPRLKNRTGFLVLR